MRRLMLAALGVALVAPGANAATGSCLGLADVAGDATLMTYEGNRLPHGGELDGLDILSVDVEATTDAVSATFTLAGTPQPRPGGTFFYEVSFEDATHAYRLVGASSYGALHWPDSGPFYIATQTQEVDQSGTTVTTGSSTGVDGSFDLAARTVTITAPSSVFDAPLTAGQEWDVTDVITKKGAMSFSAIVTDHADAPHTLVVGAGC